MLCDQCGKRQAAIHLTQIVDNAVNKVHLCEQCAEENGVQTGASVAKYPLTDFLASMGKVGQGVPVADVAGRCPFCQSTLQDFRESGRLGCPKCYDAFSRHLRDLLRRLHGASQHVGRQYFAGVTGDGPDAATLSELKEQLRRAIEEERFELAAELRDRIKVLE